jgi:hypothetical protein
MTPSKYGPAQFPETCIVSTTYSKSQLGVGVAVLVGDAIAVVGVAVDGAPVAVAGADVAVGTLTVAVDGGVVSVGVDSTTTMVLVATGAEVPVAVGSGATVVVGDGTGEFVAVAIERPVGVAAGRANSRETMSNRTVKMKPLKKTSTPRMTRYFSFIAQLFPLDILWKASAYGMISA